MADKRSKEEIKANVIVNVGLYNDAVMHGKFEESVALRDEIDNDVEEYTEIVTSEVYNELKAAENPMLAAVTRLQYLTIRVKDVRDKDFPGIILKECEDTLKNIDLITLHKMCKPTGGIGADPDWVYSVETYNMMLTADKIANLTLSREERQRRLDELSESYAISKAAKKFECGKKAVSETEFKNKLKEIIQQMIGENYNTDVACMHFVRSTYSKNGKTPLSVATARHKTLVWILAQVCNHLVTGNEFTIEHPKAKK